MECCRERTIKGGKATSLYLTARRSETPSQSGHRFLASRNALSQANVFSLQTLRALLHNERDPCPFIQRTISACGYGGKMDEDVFAVLALDKAKTFARVKPLYRACFFHNSSPFWNPCFPALSVECHAEVTLNSMSTLSGFKRREEDFKAVLSLARLSPSTFDESGAQKVVSLAPDPVLQHAAPPYGIVKEKSEVLSASFLPSPVGGSPIFLPLTLKK